MQLRRATADDAIKDAQAILEVHYAAVHGAGPKSPWQYYDDSILQAWSPEVNAERVDSWVTRLKEKPDFELITVAEVDQKIVGFSSFAPKLNELYACYVKPEAGGRQVGQALLADIESQCRSMKLGWLTLDASLNAEAFYLANGYQADGLGSHALPGGLEMRCVRMYKFLD